MISNHQCYYNRFAHFFYLFYAQIDTHFSSISYEYQYYSYFYFHYFILFIDKFLSQSIFYLAKSAHLFYYFQSQILN